MKDIKEFMSDCCKSIKRSEGRLVDALALRDEEGRDSLRKVTGSWQ